MSPAIARNALAAVVLLSLSVAPVLAQTTPAPAPGPRIMFDPKRAEAARERFEERLFQQTDTNRDDSISREEFLKQANDRFDRLDTNKDGKLAREEVRAELKGQRKTLDQMRDRAKDARKDK